MIKILIIEDDIYIRENFSEIFSGDGYDVYSASGGGEGIKLAESILPDLILCDIMMPDLNGYQVREKVSLNRKTSQIPFIFLTAKSEINDIRMGLSLGADDYITKPVSAKDLLKSVQNRLKRISELKAVNHSVVEKKFSTDKEKLLIKSSGSIELIDVKEIVLIAASGDYTTVITSQGKKISLKKSLSDWEKNLDNRVFIRIHRNKILNINFIEKIEPMFKGAFSAKIKFYPETVHFSQRCSVKIKSILSPK
jgi:DNA-binding LytR/AlgR family response regulator